MSVLAVILGIILCIPAAYFGLGLIGMLILSALFNGPDWLAPFIATVLVIGAAFGGVALIMSGIK